MTQRPTYYVMIASTTQPGKMTPASHAYVQRASAFKRARRLADATGRTVKVWAYSGPGTAQMLDVPDV